MILRDDLQFAAQNSGNLVKQATKHTSPPSNINENRLQEIAVNRIVSQAFLLNLRSTIVVDEII